MIHNKTIFVYKSYIFATNTIPFINSMKKLLITFALALAAGSLYAQSLQLNSKDYLERQVPVGAATDRLYRKESTTIG